MKRLTGHIALAAGIAGALFFAAAGPASAQPASAGFVCGRVTAYSAPTGTADGSIRIGTTTFVLRAGSIASQPPPISVGSDTCLDGRRDASGAFTSFGITLTGNAQICGPVAAFTPATATAPGSITITVGQVPPTLSVRQGVTLSPAQTTGSQCFQWAVNSADGNAEVVGYVGPASGAAPVNQLPSTSTSAPENTGAVVLSLLGALAVGVVIWRSRKTASIVG